MNLRESELIVDSFAGGGASTGIEWGLGPLERDVEQDGG